MLNTAITRGLVLVLLLGAVIVPAAVMAQDEGMSATEVQIQGFAFGPDRATVPVGGSVTWTNRDATAHSAMSPSFDTARLGQGQSASIQFDTPGEFPYNCGFHANMTGIIVVE